MEFSNGKSFSCISSVFQLMFPVISPIDFSAPISFNTSYLLKVTKFLVKISQFESLVTTEQRILVYKLFLSLNIPDSSLFFVEKLQPPPSRKKSPPSLPATPPLKTEVLSSPPFLNLAGCSTPKIEPY